MNSTFSFIAHNATNYIAQQVSYSIDKPVCKPSQIFIMPTYRCNARCVMCDMWKIKSENEVSIEEWIDLLGKIRSWLGPFWVIISGGEPFNKKGILDLLSFCRQNEIKTKVSSNGIPLTDKFCDKVIQYGPDFLSFSIDSFNLEIHDRLRGCRGVFKSCVGAIEYLREKTKDILIGITSIIMEENFRQLPEMVRWGESLGVDRILFQPIRSNLPARPDNKYWYKKNPHWISDTELLDQKLDELLKLKREGAPIWNTEEQIEDFRSYFHGPNKNVDRSQCMVRYNFFRVNPLGDVTICGIYKETIGNIREREPWDIWRSQEAKRARDKMKRCCVHCTVSCNKRYSLKGYIELYKTLKNRLGKM